MKVVMSFMMVCVFVVLWLVGGMFALEAGTNIIYNQNQCATLTEIDKEHNYRWALWGGCLVQMPSGMWVHVDKSGYTSVDLSE